MLDGTDLYVFTVEPMLCMGYIWIMWRIKSSTVKELQSPFFKFFILAGISACLNVMMNIIKRLADKVLPEMPGRDLIFNIIVYESHSFALTQTIGKVFVIASRFTAICFPLENNIWSRSRVIAIGILMYGVPAILHIFMIPPDAIYRNYANGDKIYIGVEVWAQQLSKLFSSIAYIIFIALSVPMCIASIYHLRKAQRFNHGLAKQEKSLVIYTVLITSIHLVKSAQQIFWFVTMVINDHQLFDLATIIYVFVNIPSTFVPPFLLIFMSKTVRNEVAFQFYKCGHSPTANPAQIQDATHSFANRF